MQHLTVPADVLACQQPGVPLVAAIVEGGLTRNAVHCLDCNTTIESRSRHDYRTCGCPNGTMVDGGLDYQRWGAVRPDRVSDRSQHGPPTWLVALRDARCETCGGSGRVKGMNHGPGDLLFSCPNDRCHGGRLLHDVRVETGVIDNRIGPNFGRWQTRTVRCLVDVVPVVEYRGQPDGLTQPPDSDDPFICPVPPDANVPAAGEVRFWIAHGDVHSLSPAHVDALAAACGKPPADWVGGYAVILTGVGE